MLTFFAVVIGFVIGPVVQLLVSWLLVELLLWAASAAVRRGGRKIAAGWRDLRAQLRRATFRTV